MGDTHAKNQGHPAGDVDPLSAVAPLLQSADLFLFNHEGLLAADGTGCPGHKKNEPIVSPPETSSYFLQAPLNIASLANNHVSDCDGPTLLETISELQARGLQTVGAGADLSSACRPLHTRVGDTRISFLSYLASTPNPHSAGRSTPGSAEWELCRGDSEVTELAAAGHLVVVSLHYHLGPSWTARTWPRQRAMVEEILDAGATIVAVHGPHIPQGLLTRNGGIAFLSLGNFLLNLDDPMTWVFDPDPEAPASAHESVIARVDVHQEALAVSLHPILLDRLRRPHPAPPEDGSRILELIAEASAREGLKVEIWENVGYAVVERRPLGTGEGSTPSDQDLRKVQRVGTPGTQSSG